MEKYKYDVAISFAEEDKEIAEQIGRALKDLDVKYYLFYEQDNLGEPLKKLTWKIYHEESRLALVLISEHYSRKRWAKEEQEVILTVLRREGMPYLIPIRIDDTKIDGISEQIIYKRWTGSNSYEIAVKVFKLLKQFEERNRSDGNPKGANVTKKPKIKSIAEVIQTIGENNGFVIGKVNHFNN
ncbi:MAG: toll/interleukin-1 receptor domain-containing protein [Bacteroidales bacterium]|nr:MAG: toll/interleukin-1 receptor domain-containing protein [Bacteroidales bacterium]